MSRTHDEGTEGIDETVRKVGKQGNVYEDNPAATRSPRAAVRVLRQRRAREEAAVLEAAPGAKKAVDPGGEAAPGFGAPKGAHNALNFHAWRKGEPSEGEG